MDENDPSGEQPAGRFTRAQWQLFFLVLVLGVVAALYRLLRLESLHQSAALYLALPLILALGLSLTPRAKSATGATMKGITIALLLSAPLFGEGYICLLFAAPIFYAVGALISIPIERARRRGDNGPKVQAAVSTVVVALLSLEGTSPMTTAQRHGDVAVAKVVDANVAAIERQLSVPPVFGPSKPLFLRIFPYPEAIEAEGLDAGDKWTIHFVAYQYIWWNRKEGALSLQVAERDQHRIRFRALSDTSYLSNYLTWETSEVLLEPIDDGRTRVTWRLGYRRAVDPSWYFGPLQHYAVSLAAEELIDHVATPGR